MAYLAAQGVRRDRMTMVSLGEQRPVCTEHQETCWQKNRRAGFLVNEEWDAHPARDRARAARWPRLLGGWRPDEARQYRAAARARFPRQAAPGPRGASRA